LEFSIIGKTFIIIISTLPLIPSPQGRGFFNSTDLIFSPLPSRERAGERGSFQ
jgi:hypothetical protein